MMSPSPPFISLVRLRRSAGWICTAAFPMVLWACSAQGQYIPSQVTAHDSVEDARDTLVHGLATRKLVSLGVDEKQACSLVDAALASGIAETILLKRAQDLPVADLPRDPDVRKAFGQFTSQFAGAASWTIHPGEDQYAFSRKVVGVNVPALLLVLLPIIVVVAVAASSGASAGSLLAGAAVVGLILVLFVDPSFIFGDR